MRPQKGRESESMPPLLFFIFHSLNGYDSYNNDMVYDKNRGEAPLVRLKKGKKIMNIGSITPFRHLNKKTKTFDI